MEWKEELLLLSYEECTPMDSSAPQAAGKGQRGTKDKEGNAAGVASSTTSLD